MEGESIYEVDSGDGLGGKGAYNLFLFSSQVAGYREPLWQWTLEATTPKCVKMFPVHLLYYVTLQTVNKSFWKLLCPRGGGAVRHCMFWMLSLGVWGVPRVMQSLNTYNKSKGMWAFFSLCFSFFCLLWWISIAHTICFVCIFSTELQKTAWNGAGSVFSASDLCVNGNFSLSSNKDFLFLDTDSTVVLWHIS